MSATDPLDLPADLATAVHHAAVALSRARRVLFITGAGISADSGLPTYRGIGGLYTDRATEEGMPIEEALSGRMMLRRPEVTWKYLLQVERACRGAKPNRAHEVIATLDSRDREVWVLTQNVDALHEKAGSSRVIDIHGDFRRLLCSGCGHRATVPDYSKMNGVPRCPSCSGVVRPDVVLFGELLPPAKVQVLRDQLARGFDTVFSVGTSSLFPYIAEPVHLARNRGSPTFEINPDRTEVSDEVDYRIPLGAAAALDAVWKAYEKGRRGSASGRFEVD